MITQAYKLNMIPNDILPVVYVSQYDDGARTISFELYDGAEAYTPTNAKVRIKGKEKQCTISSNVVSFVVDANFTEEAGTFLGEIVDTKDNGVVASCNFKFAVDSTPIQEENTNESAVTTLNANRAQTALKAPLLTTPDLELGGLVTDDEYEEEKEEAEDENADGNIE